ncbi:Alcohol acetyltransferase [Fusarium piperis]|uniref:Alcohol acetyltransferase n=1 Tax=Fusarium piperis TaxID=1435070 RepID=A0A9W8W758_9HYPO|nr:Alcohol acetyltransferase [Fusarium piperis]
MTVNSLPNAIRPLGPIEIYSSSRHPLGLYRCVVVTGRYTLPQDSSPSNTSILAALSNIITTHPMLRVGIVDEDTNNAHFTHIREVNLDEHVQFRDIPDEENYEDTFEDTQAWCHDQLWSNVESRPPWRIIVLRPGSNPSFEDVIFSFHHSLMDGTSSKQFHEHLLAELNTLSPESSSEFQTVLSFPEPPSLPEPQDAILAYTNSMSFWAATLWNEHGPSFLKSAKPAIWAGKSIDFAHPHKARVHAVDIQAPVVASLLSGARSHGTSITGLLHALIFASLATRIPDAPAFASSTPINMRPYMSSTADPALKDTYRVLITTMAHQFASSDVSALRNPKADLDALIWHHARELKTQIKERTATLPADDDSSLFSYISDWASHWRKKDGKERDDSWELSNIGCLSIPAPEEGKRSISRVLFTNGIMVAGGPMSISVASVPGGALTLGISWNEDVVEEAIMAGLAEDLEGFATRLHETGKFTKA